MRRLITAVVSVALATSGTLRSQSLPSAAATAELHVRLAFSQPGKHRSVPAVIWLEPLAGTVAVPAVPHGPYTLMQKNRTFLPHLQVVPVGAVVQFPNADPFFHNVFSLFDGKRFDLGLYEAGSSKSVTFSREGVSYIFCNIHPEMSAVVLALPTALFATADSDDSFVLRNIRPGDYKLRLWIEGVPQPVVDVLTRSVHLPGGSVNLGSLMVPIRPIGSLVHTNKFGSEYDPRPKFSYDH